MRASKPVLKAVIMAGGSGTRFWPLSRRCKPKQFLPIAGDKSMLRETVDRILPLIPYEDIYTIAGREHTRVIRELLPRLPAPNALIEPLGKNTAPSLILATASIYLRNPEAVIVILASDHLIADRALFLRRVKAAASVAARRESLITFGILPTFPSTGYGYIRYRREAPLRSSGGVFFPVLEFKEKPGFEQAQAFLAEGGHYWNSGMFVWRAGVFARMLEAYAPDFYPFWRKTLDALRTGSAAKLRSVFRDIKATSIDYALMEKAQDVLVSQGDFGWSDVGAWSSLFDVWEKDAAGNAFKGRGLALDSTGTLCYNPGKFTALIGVHDFIVVDTPDALLICPRNQDQRVKNVLEALAKAGDKKHL